MSMPGQIIDISEIGRTIEEYFEHKEPTEAELILLNNMASGEEPGIHAVMLYMVMNGDLVAYIDQGTGELVFRRPSYRERFKMLFKR